MPRHPSVYGNLLREFIDRHEVECWLVNTGWTGGPYGTGSRVPLKNTRQLLDAALSGELATGAMRLDPLFGFDVPLFVTGLDNQAILTPRDCWADQDAYDAMAAQLVNIFTENFKTFAPFVAADVQAAGPRL